MHRRSTISRWIPERWIGKDRRAQEDISRGVVVDEYAAELAALLTCPSTACPHVPGTPRQSTRRWSGRAHGSPTPEPRG
ncbi:hypothetical protein ABZ468_50070 [Streptomyces sp. NPDC005708]|uniref:hypothetical protein n=1 Tax=Streptomyces sp. NPDC005708 TaxID=3154564 RepID=UPI0033D51205